MKENQKIMTAKISGSRKLKRSSLPKFNNDIYPLISSSSLVVYSVHYLIEREIEVKMEDIVFACFLLFPQKFSLKKYPRWPDSAAVGRRLGSCRSKGYIAANIDLGFKLTAKGSRLAEKVAKALGMSTAKRMVKAPHPQPKERAEISKEKINEPVKAAKVPSSPPKVHDAKPTKISKPTRRKKLTLPAPIKPIKIMPTSAQVKKVKPVQKEKVIQLDLIKVEPVHTKKESPASAKQVETQIKKKKIVPVPKPAKKVKPAQVGKTKPAEHAQPVKAEKVQIEKSKLVTAGPVTKEAKERAWKFTRLMDGSDAYAHYKKNGSKSNISEFDFRSLLLCTMESSAETLARNVELFKDYAGVHDRQDLIVFLNFCEDKFSYLLKPQTKPAKKLRR